MNNYGVLTTYNPYTKLWYAFNNEDVDFGGTTAFKRQDE
jgi:hypothetical protein